MKKLPLFLVFLGILALWGCKKDIKCTTVKGTVVEFYSSEPIAGIKVEVRYSENGIESTLKESITDESGEFKFKFRTFKEREYYLTFTKEDYFLAEPLECYDSIFNGNCSYARSDKIANREKNDFTVKLYKAAYINVQAVKETNSVLVEYELPYYHGTISGLFGYNEYPWLTQVPIVAEKEQLLEWQVNDGTSLTTHTMNIYLQQGESKAYKLIY